MTASKAFAAFPSRAAFAEAIRAVSEIEEEEDRVDVLVKIAGAQAQAGFPAESVLTAQRIRTALDTQLPEIAATFAALGDKEHFKRLLIACAYYPDAADRMCRLLIQLYPEQSAEVAAAVLATR